MVASIKSRSKAIKNKTSTYNLQKVIEKEDGNAWEKLEIDFILRSRLSVRMFVWDDRWAWIDVRKSAKYGWEFEWQHEGRIGSATSKQIVNKLENTFTWGNSHRVNELQKCWFEIMHEGPKGV